jgi:uncharacterized membrane protein YvlD (DUF360 family)
MPDDSQTTPGDGRIEYGQTVGWQPEVPRLTFGGLLASWIVLAIAVFVAAAIVPHVTVERFRDALLAAALIAVLNALLPPIIAALRLPFTLALAFPIVLLLDALMLRIASLIDPNAIRVDAFGWALVASIVIAATVIAIEAFIGANDEQIYSLYVIRRIARRQGGQVKTDVPGILFLEIDGLALPVLQRAIRDGNVPELARWLERGSHQLTEWETDLSSQTGASQAGILLGSNEDIPAFRWAEKESGRIVACSSPQDCAEIEQRLATGRGLLIDDGASRGNLFSGEADAVILTVSRMSSEKQANPGYRAFLANGFNAARLLALFWWEVGIERVAAVQQRRRDVQPRGHRGGRYPFIRATLCVAVRELILFGVLTDMMRGRPAIYATFSSYDEVAHHSGLERADTLEALRKLDKQFSRIEGARRFAPRPYKLVVLSDHGQTQGATFKQRNGYGLQDLVERSLEDGTVARAAAGDEHDVAVQHAVAEATGRAAADGEHDVARERNVVVLGSGNLGLVYLMEVEHRLTLEEIDALHPRLLPALREHPHIGFLLVDTSDRGPVALSGTGTRYLAEDRVEGEDPLAGFSVNAAKHLLRTHSFKNAPDILINSFYDPELEQGCAFEELISFHGGLGGPQTRPFILHPVDLELPAEPIVGAATVHTVLAGWRHALQGEASTPTVSIDVTNPAVESH